MRFSLRLAVLVGSFGILLHLPAIESAASEEVSLAGAWGFRLDPSDQGIREPWWESDLAERIQLPGALQAQGYGNAPSVNTNWTGQIVDRSWFTAPEYARYRQPGNIKVPFWLQPEKHYVGPAWYQREIELPQAWQGKRIVLNLERPHWETRVWLDDRSLGSNDSLSTPHEYDLGTQVTPGKHRLTIRVDNRLVVDVGINSHSVSDHTQSNWKGIVGRIELEATQPVVIADLQVYPRVATRSILVNGRLVSAAGKPGQGEVRLTAQPTAKVGSAAFPELVVPVAWDAKGATFETEYPLGTEASLGDEFQPTLYRLTAAIDGGESKSITFGLREIGTEGTRFVLNGRKIFVRGTLECCIFPKTGYPPTEVPSWKRILRAARCRRSATACSRRRVRSRTAQGRTPSLARSPAGRHARDRGAAG